MYDDFVAFERRIVERFIDVTLQATRTADPNHLIASNRHNIDGVEVWMRHIDLWARCDLVALSMYPRHQYPGLGPAMCAILDDVAERTGRPIIFGEWSVPALVPFPLTEFRVCRSSCNSFRIKDLRHYNIWYR